MSEIPAPPDWEDLGLEGPDDTVLREAALIVEGARQNAYGHPKDNHGATAEMMRAYLERRYGGPVEFDAQDVCVFHILEKISRHANRAKRDNLVDIAGYARNLEMLDEEAQP